MQRKILSVALVICMLLSMFPFAIPASAVTTAPAGAIEISTAEQFANIGNTTYNADYTMGATYVMMNDIDMEGVAMSPIGTAASNTFTGSFYGNGHTLSNVSISTAISASARVGVFGHATGGTFCDLTVTGSVTNVGAGMVGGIIGCLSGGLADNLVSYVTVTNTSPAATTASFAGGVLGGVYYSSAQPSTIIQNCVSYAEIISNCGRSGGILGTAQFGLTATSQNGHVEILDCANFSDIEGANQYVGGIAGYVGQGFSSTKCGTTTYHKIARCANFGDISASGYAGGICGYLYGRKSATIPTTIEECYNVGTISTTTAGDCGGILGLGNTAITVSNCYNAGAINGTAAATLKGVGGVVGRTNGVFTVEKCYNAGAVTGNYDIGAVIGTAAGSCTGSNNYYLEGTCANASGGGSGTIGTALSLNSTLLKDSASYIGFDFTDTWAINGNAYPYAKLANVTAFECETHTPTGDWQLDADNHWKYCALCDNVASLAAHTYADGVCSVCGAADPSACAHTSTHYAWDLEGEYAATCIATGIGHTVCDNCGDTIESNVTIPIDTENGHDWVAGTIVAPKCFEGGYTNFTCSRCSETKTDIPTEQVGHHANYKWTRAGVRYNLCCEVCGEGLLTTTLTAANVPKTIYLSATGADISETNYGADATTPVNSFEQAMALAASAPGDTTVYISGTVTVPIRRVDGVETGNYYFEPDHTNKITVTSADISAKAVISMGAAPLASRYYLRGDTEFNNVEFDSGSYTAGLVFSASGNELTMGEGIVVATAEKTYIVGWNGDDPSYNGTVGSTINVYSGDHYAVMGIRNVNTPLPAFTATNYINILGDTTLKYLIPGSSSTSSVATNAAVTTIDGNLSVATGLYLGDQHDTGNLDSSTFVLKSGTLSATVSITRYFDNLKVYHNANDAGAVAAYGLIVPNATDYNAEIPTGNNYGTLATYCTNELGGHNFVNEVCTVCGTSSACQHTTATLVIDAAATCVATGAGHRVCDECGITTEADVVIPVDLTNHAGNIEFVAVEGGYQIQCSAGCGTTYSAITSAPVVYVSDNGGEFDVGNDGTIADMAINDLSKAYELLATTGGTVKIVDSMTIVKSTRDQTTQKAFVEPAHTGKITLTSADITAKGSLNFDNATANHYYFSGEGEWNNIIVHATTNDGVIIAARENFVTMGEGLEMTGDATAPAISGITGNPTKIYFFGGYNTSDTTAQTEQTNHIAVYSGEYWWVAGYNRAITSTVSGTAIVDLHGGRTIYYVAGSTGGQSLLENAKTLANVFEDFTCAYQFVNANQNVASSQFDACTLLYGGATVNSFAATSGYYRNSAVYYDANNVGATTLYNEKVADNTVVNIKGTFADYCTQVRDGHTYDETTHICSFCGLLDASVCAHTNVTLVVDTAATCVATGLGHNVCDLCGQTTTQDVEIPIDTVNGHDWVAGTAVPVTCTADGYTPYECSLCHETKQGEVVTSNGHLGAFSITDGNLVCNACSEVIITGAPNLDTVYVSADGAIVSAENYGATLETATSSIDAALALLGADGGTVKVSGRIVMPGMQSNGDGTVAFVEPAHTGKITITSNDVNNRATLVLDRSLPGKVSHYYLSGETEFNNIIFDGGTSGSGVIIAARANHITMGENLTMVDTGDTAGLNSSRVYLIGGITNADISAPADIESLNTHITLKSGEYRDVVAQSRGTADARTFTGSATIDVLGDIRAYNFVCTGERSIYTGTSTLNLNGNLRVGLYFAPGNITTATAENTVVFASNGTLTDDAGTARTVFAGLGKLTNLKVYYNANSTSAVNFAEIARASTLTKTGATKVVETYEWYCTNVRGSHTFVDNVCSFCGFVKVCDHKYVLDETTLVLPTASEAGSATVTCKECEDTQQLTIPSANIVARTVSATGEQGSSVVVKINVGANPGFWGMRFTVAYDSTAFTLTGFETYDAQNHPTYVDLSDVEFTPSEELTENPYKITFTNNASIYDDLTLTGDFIGFVFDIADDAAVGEYPIILTLPETIDHDNNSTDLPTTALNGAVTVTAATCEHDGTRTLTVDTAATCGVAGVGHYVCDICGETVESNVVIPATGEHGTLTLVVDTAATCGAAGVGHKTCDVCGETVEENVVIPATGEHGASTLVVDTAATCGAAGVGHNVCDVCGETVEENVVIPATGEHTWGTTYSSDADGHWRTCTVCSATETSVAHTLEYSHDDDGHWQVCSVCEYTTATVDHSYVEGVCVCGAEEPAAKVLYGDVNGDGAVNSVDASLVSSFALSYISANGFNHPDGSAVALVAADVNGDGSVNSVDASLISSYAVASISVFPVEAN